MRYQPIVGSLGYLLSKDRKKVLLVHRLYKDNDDHQGKFNGLGGKMEKNEDIATCMKREIYEESGLIVRSMSLRGTINWTNFGKNGEDWLGFIFLITDYEGTPFKESAEGPLEWIPIEKISSLPMWEGDRFFIPLVFDEDPRLFHGFMPYENHQPKSWSFTRI
jgi:8-oxo-dGTP diphosphatase